MTLTFKDPNGVEWELIAHACAGFPGPLPRHAEPADLLAALGQLSTEGGPTDEELRALFAQVLQAGGWTLEAVRAAEVDGFRALFNAGAASRQAEVDRLTAENAEYRTQVHQENLLKTDLEAAESELAATKARLAEVERELSDYKADAASAEEALREDLGKERAKTRAQRAELHSLNKLRRGEVESAIALRSELASARRVVEPLRELMPWIRATDCGRVGNALTKAIDAALEGISHYVDSSGRNVEPPDALASAGTDADRTEPPKCEHQWEPHFSAEMCKLCGRCRSPLAKEPPRPEAGEHDWYRGFDGAYHSHDWHCAHCGEGRNGSEPDARGCKGRPKPPGEPKPEPQPSGSK